MPERHLLPRNMDRAAHRSALTKKVKEKRRKDWTMAKTLATGRKPRCDGERTREAIVAAAELEFSERGFELASMREVCRKAKANAALAGRYFDSKENLYRLVAKRLFGDLGAPMAELAAKATDEASWRAALREWVWDFLFMTIPTEKSQRLCRGLFRHEVVSPTRFHKEFLKAYGKPIYDSLRALIAKVEDDPVQINLWTSSVWAQITVYALADMSWHKSFRPEGVSDAEWREILTDFICGNVFAAFPKKGGR